jgi:hypothetical protein
MKFTDACPFSLKEMDHFLVKRSLDCLNCKESRPEREAEP